MTLVPKIVKLREAVRAAKRNGRADTPTEELEEVTALFDEEDAGALLDATLDLIQQEQHACATRASATVDRLKTS